MRVLAAVAAISISLAGSLAGGAYADEAIPTAPRSGPSAPPTTAPGEGGGEGVRPLDAMAPESRPVAMGLCGPQAVKADGSLETKPHGMIEAGVGTGGYRHLAASVCQPIGQNAAVAVSVSDTRGTFGSRRARFVQN